MKVLLDTHVFLWLITEDPRLSEPAREVLGEADNEVFFSAASGWEIAIKAALGRLVLPDAPARFVPSQLAANALKVLPVHLGHALKVYDLPPVHDDPFDRILIAQALVEDLPIVSADPLIARYAVSVVW